MLGPDKRDWLWLVCTFAAFCLFVYFVNRISRGRFDAMTAAEHLKASRVALAEGRYDDGLLQVSAINAAVPQAVEARKVEEALVAAKEAARQKEAAAKEAARRELAEAQQAARLAEEGRMTAIRDLQNSLRDLGYDLTVAQSDKKDEIVITSRDFDDTDHRVRFLSFLRRRNSPSTGVCLAGFQTVHLKGSGWFFEFSEAYPLECFSLR